MSLRVLVICEDGSLDQYLAKPLVELVLADLGKPNAQVNVLMNPRVTGFQDAYDNVRDNLDKYVGTHKVWVFLPDGDQKQHLTKEALTHLKQQVKARGAELAIAAFDPELEILALAPFINEHNHTIQDMRQHPRLKEDVYEPFSAQRFPQSIGQGRKAAMKHVEASWKSIRSQFREIADLSAQLKTILENSL